MVSRRGEGDVDDREEVLSEPAVERMLRMTVVTVDAAENAAKEGCRWDSECAAVVVGSERRKLAGSRSGWERDLL